MKLGPPSPGAFHEPRVKTNTAGMPANTNAVVKAAKDPYLRGNLGMYRHEKTMPPTKVVIPMDNPNLLMILGSDKSGSPGPLIAIRRIMGCVIERVTGIEIAATTKQTMAANILAIVG